MKLFGIRCVPWFLALLGACALVGKAASASVAGGAEFSPASNLPAEHDPEEPAPRTLDEDQAVVTFSGLRVHDDGSSTFRVDLTHETPVEFTQDKKTLRFFFQGARVALRTNRYPLRAEYFGSNVLRTKLDNEKGGARLEIQLRAETRPAHRMLNHAGGATLTIEIPKAPKE